MHSVGKERAVRGKIGREIGREICSLLHTFMDSIIIPPVVNTRLTP